MSAFSVIQDVSVLLRREIYDALASAPGVTFTLSDPATNVRLEPPGDEGEATYATLYLYQVELDRHLRNQRNLPSRQDPSRSRRPPLTLQLRYLFTPADSLETNNQLLLGRVLQHFHDHPLLPVPGEEPRDSHGGASVDLRVVPETPSLEQLTQLWNALNEPFRLSVVFLVEVVAIDSGLPPQAAPRVGSFHTLVGTGEAP
ncbi:MAG: DUF4255 domain-containing protein [Gemmatimonadales bacterium]|nr:MAG: DUF4255 domain-containing protein [Gemmatimonadales bacterium]